MWSIFKKNKGRQNLQDEFKQIDITKEYARVIDWTPKWDIGAPMPQVFSNGYRTFLIYMISEPDPSWDNTFVTMVDNASDETYPLALVEFKWVDTH